MVEGNLTESTRDAQQLKKARYPYTHGGVRLTGRITPTCPECGNDRAIGDYSELEHHQNYAGKPVPEGDITGVCAECGTSVTITREDGRTWVDWDTDDAEEDIDDIVARMDGWSTLRDRLDQRRRAMADEAFEARIEAEKKRREEEMSDEEIERAKAEHDKRAAERAHSAAGLASQRGA